MTDIFISYTSADRPRVQPLVDALRLQGWSVWWDRTILPGETWDQVIEKALADARCVIVLWSRDSIQSDWVRTEADEAKRRGILVPALLDDVNIPLAFKRIQAGNLVGWSGALPNAAFDVLARAVSEVLARGAPLAPEATTRRASAAPAPAAAAPEVRGIERSAAFHKAGEGQVRAEAGGSAKTERAAPRRAKRKRLASEVEAKQEFHPAVAAQDGRPPLFEAATRPASASSAPAAAAPEGRGIERGAAFHKAGEGQVAAETSGSAKTVGAAPQRDEREPLASEVEAKQEFHPSAVTQNGGSPLFDVRAPSTSWKRVIIFGFAAVALLIGIVIYTQTGKEQLVPGQVRENPKDGLTYVWIPAGSFTMGCSQGDSECQPDEKPSHPVVISKGFWMGQTEVTQDAYQRVMGQNPSRFQGAQRPVEQVNWNQASEYCGKVALRLPTEAEWEYAARAGTGGARYGDLDKVAWYTGNSGGGTKPVRSLQPNPWGLYDMLGNVEEWIADRHGEEHSEAGKTTNPIDLLSKFKVVRGGSWLNDPQYVRVSSRGLDMLVARNYNIGFRCAGELP